MTILPGKTIMIPLTAIAIWYSCDKAVEGAKVDNKVVTEVKDAVLPKSESFDWYELNKDVKFPYAGKKISSKAMPESIFNGEITLRDYDKRLGTAFYDQARVVINAKGSKRIFEGALKGSKGAANHKINNWYLKNGKPVNNNIHKNLNLMIGYQSR